MIAQRVELPLRRGRAAVLLDDVAHGRAQLEVAACGLQREQPRPHRRQVVRISQDLQLGLAHELVHLRVALVEGEAQQGGPGPRGEVGRQAPGGLLARRAIEALAAPGPKSRSARRPGSVVVASSRSVAQGRAFSGGQQLAGLAQRVHRRAGLAAAQLQLGHARQQARSAAAGRPRTAACGAPARPPRPRAPARAASSWFRKLSRKALGWSRISPVAAMAVWPISAEPTASPRARRTSATLYSKYLLCETSSACWKCSSAAS